MKSLMDLFQHQIKDLYSAEKQLIEVLPTLEKNATDKRLKILFNNHLEETKHQLKRLENICRELTLSPSGEKCKAMKGLLQEVEDFIKKAEDYDVMDAGLIAHAQRVEHYEISGYGTAVRFAQELGQSSIAEKLKETLNEEYDADNNLDILAEGRLNREALA